MTAVNPYLNFSGNCEEAFTFYHSVFGGEPLHFMRFSEMPSEGDDDHQMSAEAANLIMHVALPIGDTMLMGSDRPASMGPTEHGNGYYISVQVKGHEEAHRIFDALAEDGTIGMPMGEMFWGAVYGMLTDKFGIQWMVNGEHA